MGKIEDGQNTSLTDLHIGDQVDHGYRVLRQLVVVQLNGPGADK